MPRRDNYGGGHGQGFRNPLIESLIAQSMMGSQDIGPDPVTAFLQSSAGQQAPQQQQGMNIDSLINALVSMETSGRAQQATAATADADRDARAAEVAAAITGDANVAGINAAGRLAVAEVPPSLDPRAAAEAEERRYNLEIQKKGVEGAGITHGAAVAAATDLPKYGGVTTGSPTFWDSDKEDLIESFGEAMAALPSGVSHSKVAEEAYKRMLGTAQTRYGEKPDELQKLIQILAEATSPYRVAGP